MRARSDAGLREGPGAFTLVELLLAVALVLMLLGAVVLNFWSQSPGLALEEGGAQVEAAIHLARGAASTGGGRVRLSLPLESMESPLTNAMEWSMLREPDPGSTGESPVEVPGARGLLDHLLTLVRVVSVGPGERGSTNRFAGDGAGIAGEPGPVPSGVPSGAGEPGAVTTVAGAAAGRNLGSGADGSVPVPLPSIVFHPDGSSDSVEIVLESRDGGGGRRMLVRLDGSTGLIRRRLLERDPGSVQGQAGEEEAAPRDASTKGQGETESRSLR